MDIQSSTNTKIKRKNTRRLSTKLDRSSLRSTKNTKQDIRSQYTWVVCMLIAGSLDIIVTWMNFLYYSSIDRYHGLIIGPVPQLLYKFLLIFTICGSALYVIETANTISVIFNNGETKISILLEQAFVLSLECIPLNVTNYFIMRCQENRMSVWQHLSGVIVMTFNLARLLWYAQLEGNRLQYYLGKDDDKDKANIVDKVKTQVKSLFTSIGHGPASFLTICTLYSIAIAFPIVCWREAVNHISFENKLKGISIHLVQSPFSFNNSYLNAYSVPTSITSKGDCIVSNVQSIVDSGYKIIHRDCHELSNMPLCKKRKNQINLIFKFIYDSNKHRYGEISYNVAMYSNHSNKSCQHLNNQINLEWGLYYIETVEIRNQKRVIQPWKDYSCIPPQPFHDENINIC